MNSRINARFSATMFALTLLTACSSAETLRSDAAPAATAEVTTKKTGNGNTQLRLQVDHLAAPSRVDADANHYVVWITPKNAENPQNVGTLVVDKNLHGDYETTIPYGDFELKVTAERNRLVSVSSGTTVFEHTFRQ